MLPLQYFKLVQATQMLMVNGRVPQTKPYMLAGLDKQKLSPPSLVLVTLPTITRTGSTCGWATSSTATTWNYASGASITPTSNLTLYGVCRNNITLNQNGATTNGSTSATVNYNATSLSAITVPQRKYTVSGFTKTTSGANSTVSATTTLTSTYTLLPQPFSPALPTLTPANNGPIPPPAQSLCTLNGPAKPSLFPPSLVLVLLVVGLLVVPLPPGHITPAHPSPQHQILHSMASAVTTLPSTKTVPPLTAPLPPL